MSFQDDLQTLSEWQQWLPFLTLQEQEQYGRLLKAKAAWELLPKQEEVRRSEAFETLYAGQKGAGKSQVICYLARHEHHTSLLIRRTFPDLERTLIKTSLEKYEDRDHYNASNHRWSWPEEERDAYFGYLDNEKDVHQFDGLPELDLLCPDELTQFPEAWYLHLVSCIRTTRLGQRCRIVATSNPGGEYEAWVFRRWAAWLDPKYLKPAVSGEVRWFRKISDDEEIESDASDPLATSRTWIESKREDNPYLDPDMERRLNMLPDVLRKQYGEGKWGLGQKGSEWQVIPTAWVEAAQARWVELRKQGFYPQGPMDQLGLDVARGGKDKTVLIPRYRTWFAEPIKFPGADTPDGMTIVQHVATISNHQVYINDSQSSAPRHLFAGHTVVGIDAVGVGSSPLDGLQQGGYNVWGINGNDGSDATDKPGVLHFANLRSELHWKLREALDPQTGEGLALPPGPEVLADLTATRWHMESRGIRVEEKDCRKAAAAGKNCCVKHRLGHSPDVGDTIVYAHAQGQEAEPFVY